MKKGALFWPLAFTLVLADCSTKRLAVEHLTPPHVPHDVVGDIVRLTLAYNPCAAMGLCIGPFSRWAFVVLTIVALAALWQLYRRAPTHDHRQIVALALVCGGAVGNLLDRLRSPRGVVDFIDIGVGDVRFWTFNVADVGVSIGAVLLAVVLWRQETAAAAAGELAEEGGAR
jgi:signal peptidase II